MSSGTPISKAELRDLINTSRTRMSPPQRHLWDAIKVEPTRWKQHPYGTGMGGFWVVAIFGQTVIWYNEIEEGFNRSRWSKLGDLDEYHCNQDDLEWTVQHILNEMTRGTQSGNVSGPPEDLN